MRTEVRRIGGQNGAAFDLQVDGIMSLLLSDVGVREQTVGNRETVVAVVNVSDRLGLERSRQRILQALAALNAPSE